MQSSTGAAAAAAADKASSSTSSAMSWRDMGTSWQRMQYYLRSRFLLDRGKLRAHDEVVVVGAGSSKQCTHHCNSSLADNSDAACSSSSNSSADAFVDTVVQRQLLYFSYRYQFAPLPNKMTSDAGWGCLLRTGQMLLAHALVRHYANDAVAQCDAAALSRVREHVRALFMDTPTAPFGVHALQDQLHASGVAYGTLLTPTQMAVALAAACARYNTPAATAARPLVALCCAGGDVDAVHVRSTLQQQQQEPASVLLLIPLNLGLNGLSAKYAEALRRVLAMRSACGVAGGAQSTSVLYIGYQHDTLLYLDPHYMQRAYTSPATYGRRTALRAQLPMRESNTSMLLGCYLHDAAALDVFAAELQHVNAPLLFPLISLVTRTRTSGSASGNGDNDDSSSSGQPIELLSISDDAGATRTPTP